MPRIANHALRDLIAGDRAAPRQTVKLGGLVAGARFELAIPQLRDYEISLPAMPVIR